MIRRLVLLLAVVLVSALAVPAAAVAAPDDVVKVAVVRTAAQNGGRPDSLAQIAQRTLGDPARATEILDLNRARPQSDGSALTDSGELRPGWILLLPADATGPDVRLGRVAATPGGSDTPLLNTQVTAALIGAVVLALLALLVIFRRRIIGGVRSRYRAYADNARWHRQIQERMQARARLAAEFAADQSRPALAWQASAELTAAQVETYALRVDATAVTAWVTADHAPRWPWQAETDGVWTRPADLPTARPTRGDGVTPCLVRVGGEDGTLFVDLTWLDGVLSIGGSAGVAIDVLANLLADLTRFRSDLPVFSVPGLGGEPPGVPQTAVRLRSVTDLRVAGSAPGTDDGMVRLAARRGTLTSVAVIAEIPTDEQAAHLLAACGPGTGQVAIVLGDLPGARWRWHAEADGKVRLPEIGLTVTAPSR
ncbi:hypothetical protein [Actinoplanes sp. NPDC026670]|uniref:hypothetical protein n=1 Tax=Actinoplanes sp. NPDC026670 TaxID=3154700 RepID=UPI0033FBECCE